MSDREISRGDLKNIFIREMRLEAASMRQMVDFRDAAFESRENTPEWLLESLRWNPRSEEESRELGS